jgi:hypothetical protein
MISLKMWLTQFVRNLPEENKANLRKHIRENVGIFNPKLHSDREFT